jgi:alcohol dehydrogenase class IV
MVRLISAHSCAPWHGMLEARANLALGSLSAGLPRADNTGRVHALAYPLGGEFHVAHGVSNALLPRTSCASTVRRPNAMPRSPRWRRAPHRRKPPPNAERLAQLSKEVGCAKAVRMAFRAMPSRA